MKKIILSLSLISSLFASEYFLDSSVIEDEYKIETTSYFCDDRTDEVITYTETELKDNMGMISADLGNKFYLEDGKHVKCDDFSLGKEETEEKILDNQQDLFEKEQAEQEAIKQDEIAALLPISEDTINAVKVEEKQNSFIHILDEDILVTKYGEYNVITYCKDGLVFQLTQGINTFSNTQIFEKNGPLYCEDY